MQVQKKIEVVNIIDDDKPLPSNENGKESTRVKLITLKNEEVNMLEIEDCSDEEDNNLSKTSSTTVDISENSTELIPEFETFLGACLSCKCERKYKDLILKKIPNIKCKYTDADENYVTSNFFKEYVIRKTQEIERKPADGIIIFNEIFRELESKRKQKLNLTSRENIHLKKLKSALNKVNKKIKQLESEPVDFEDDNNSSYIKLDWYKTRSCKIFKKICSLTQENFHAGRYLYRNLNCNASKYPEINRAVDKLYNKRKIFPSCSEIAKCIRKCVKNHSLNLTEDCMDREIRLVFKAVGSILQRRRKKELYESMSYFSQEGDDPADKDPELDKILSQRYIETEKKIDEVMQKYADYQEKGEEPSLSSDSDDSHYSSEESDS